MSGPKQADASLRTLRTALGTEFDVEREVGRGAVGSVFRARETSLGRPVAIKVLHPALAADPTARKRFEREARAAAALTHPNIVHVHRFGSLPDGNPFLVMRYVEGRTLEERLRAEGRLPADIAVRALLDVAGALAAAHAHGIVHRDVRPGNVLWDDRAERALLADFGIAAVLTPERGDAVRLTRTGQFVGDPRYLSPEQLLDEELTGYADVYAFGVLGYELLSGEGPYGARAGAGAIAAHLHEDPSDLRGSVPDVDPVLADLLARCLNREPRHRPSAQDLVRVLSRRVGGAGDGGLATPLDADAIDRIIERRVPQIVIVTGGLGLGLMSVMNELTADQQLLPPVLYRLTLPFVASAVAASAVLAWFHGERGRQKVRATEWLLLGLIGVVWLALSAWVWIDR